MDEAEIIKAYLADKRIVQGHFDSLMKKNEALEIRDFLATARKAMLVRIDAKWAEHLNDHIANSLQEY